MPDSRHPEQGRGISERSPSPENTRHVEPTEQTRHVERRAEPEVETPPDDFAFAVEESIRKKFHRTIFSRFTKSIVTYDLLQPGDRVAVCISGGKDSMLLAKLFQELQRHKKFPFETVFLTMDPGYKAENRALIEQNAKKLGIPLTIFETDIFVSPRKISLRSLN